MELLKHSALAQLSQLALGESNMKSLLDEAVNLITKTLGVKYALVLDLLKKDEGFIVRAGVGWQKDIVSKVILAENEQAVNKLLSATPVIIELGQNQVGRGEEEEFLAFLHAHGVVSGISAVIKGQEQPFGILSACTNRQQKYSEDDVNFVKALANILAKAIELQRKQAALQASHDQLIFALDVTRMGIWDWNILTGEVKWSDTLEALHGLAPGTFKGTFAAFLECVHSEDCEFVRHAIAGAVEHKENYNIEFRIVWPDGSVHWIQAQGRVFCNEAGYSVRMIGVGLDITERKQVEEALSQSEQHYRNLADAMPLIVWTAQPDGAVDYFNQRWFEYTETTIEQSKGWGWQSVVHPDDRVRCLEDWKIALETGSGCEVEYRFRRSDGSYRWHLGRAMPMRDRQGKIVSWVGTATDIDAQKQTQEAERFLSQASKELASSLDYQSTLERVVRLAVPTVGDWCAVDVWEKVEREGEWGSGGVGEWESGGVGEWERGGEGEWESGGVGERVNISSQSASIRRLAVAHVDPSKVEWAQELQERYPHDPNDRHGVANVLRSGKSELYTDIPDSLLVATARDAEHLAIMREIGFSSAMVVPMIARDRTLGAITFVSDESGRHYSASDLALAEDLACRAALAVDNARLYRESQEAEAALRESEERFRAMANSAPVMLWMSGTDGQYTFFNQAWLNFTGRSMEEELGIGWVEEVHPEDVRCCGDIYMTAFNVRKPFEMEYRLRSRLGEYRWIVDTGTPRFMPDGTFAGYIGCCVDITERKSAAEAMRSRATELAHLSSVLAKTNMDLEKRNQELDQFAYIVSHDLKAPLRAIANLSQWIEEDLQDLLTGDTKHQMNLLRGRVHRMEALIEGILTYSRVGRVKTAKKIVDVGTLLKNIIDSLAPPPTFTITLESEMPVFATEQLLLEQVFANLISNAIKHHHRSDGRIDISVQDRGDFYEFVVRDDGPGIDPQYHEKVFVIFQTLVPRDRVENTGIGLSLVKKIVEDKGGSVRLESHQDRGATFRFTWPK
nr:PAS domain-containing protein [Argonema antarcticum]